QIEIAQFNAAGNPLLGNGPNQVNLNSPITAACANGGACPGDPQFPGGLRTVDGTFNNLVPIPDQHLFGAADRLFPRLTTPVFRLSAPFNLMFTFFGQFFDHGLDLVTKGGSGTVIIPLQPDDPLFVPGSPTNFMPMPRGQNQAGPDGILGTADDLQETMNT